MTDAEQRGQSLNLENVTDFTSFDFWDDESGRDRIDFDLEETLDALAFLGVIADWEERGGEIRIQRASGWSSWTTRRQIAADLRTTQSVMNNFAG